jgi:hypothetical protein
MESENPSPSATANTYLRLLDLLSVALVASLLSCEPSGRVSIDWAFKKIMEGDRILLNRK